MKNKRRGFTLVELIVCIGLLAIIGTVIVIKLKPTTNVPEEDTLTDIIDTYYYLNQNKNDFKSYYQNSSDRISCLKVQTLLDKGLIEEKDLKDFNTQDILKIIQNDDGVIKTYTKVSDSQKECNYLVTNMNNDVSNGSISVKDDEDDNENFNITQTIKQNSSDKNIFDSQLSFSAKLFEEVVKPVYVLIMLDKSGSMISNDSSRNALKAISSMVNKVYEIENTYVGFIPFGYHADNFKINNDIWFAKDYKSQILNSVNSIYYVNGEDNNYYEAYNMAINTYNVTKMSDYFTYVVLLSDAGNNNNGTTCISSANTNNVAATIRNNVTKFIAVAYSPATTCLNDIASMKCGTNDNERCYYLSSSSNVETIFDGISTKIKDETQLKSAEVKLTLGKYFTIDSASIDTTKMKYNEKDNTLIINYDFTNTGKEDYSLLIDYSLKFLAKNYSNSVVGEQKINILTSIDITINRKTGDSESIHISEDRIPSISVITSEESAIN